MLSSKPPPFLPLQSHHDQEPELLLSLEPDIPAPSPPPYHLEPPPDLPPPPLSPTFPSLPTFPKILEPVQTLLQIGKFEFFDLKKILEKNLIKI